jgi:hypothetical protein
VHLERLGHRLVLAVTSGIFGFLPPCTPGHPVIYERLLSFGLVTADAHRLVP